MERTILFVSCLVFTFAVTVLILKKLIPVLKSKKMGQHILDIGPRWHRSKEGTPTMGGLSFIIASAVAGIAACVYLFIRGGGSKTVAMMITLLYAISNGVIGMIDDLAKLKKAQNEGLTPPQKYLLQLILAGVYLSVMRGVGCLTTELYIPFADISLDLGIFYYIFALILLTGMVNAVNLTDGIDGLVSSVTTIVGVFFALCAFILTDSMEGVVPPALMIGSCLGFLIYNFYPARVFMGDTGSLFLGALVTGCAFLMESPLVIVLAGIIYIAEAASVMLQVAYFKLTHGKRLFRMAPIHHHFEKCGWSELRIVGVFTFVTVLFCAVAWFGMSR